MDNLAGGGAHLQEGRAADKSKSIFSAGLLIYQKIFLSVPALVLIVCAIYYFDFSTSEEGKMRSQLKAQFLPFFWLVVRILL